MTPEELDRLLEALPRNERQPDVPAAPPERVSPFSPAGEAVIGMLRAQQSRPLGASVEELEAKRLAARRERVQTIMRSRAKYWSRIRDPRLARALASNDSPCGLVLGPSGIGKTAAARWLGARYPGCWASARELAAAERHHPLGEGVAPLLRQAIEARHLYLDDIGTEEGRDLGHLQHVIDQRYAAGRATFATTGLTQVGLTDYLGAPYVRRLVQQHVWQGAVELGVLVLDCHASGGV